MGLLTLLEEGGPIMPLILVCALAGYVMCCERLLAWSGWRWADRRLYGAAGAEALDAALEAAARGERPTPLAWLLLRARRERRAPEPVRERRAQLDLLARMPAVEARIATIGWLGSILPTLGLLGTVSGMVGTFKELALTTSRQVLSQGLSEALWTTEVGLLGALPLLAVHHLLSRMKARWLNELERGLALLDAAADPPPAAEATPAATALPPARPHEA